MYVTLRDPASSERRPSAPGQVASRVAGTVVLLGIVSMLTDVSSEMINAVLPLYLTTQVGLGLLAYGFIDGIYQGASALVRILGGVVADRGQRPKWVAVFGYGVSALSRLAMLPAHGFAAITAVVTADRLGKGLRTAPRDALIADASDPAFLGRSFGLHRALDTVGAAAGPVAAFALLALVPGSYDSIFVASFAFGLMGLAVLVFLVPNRRTGSASRRVGFRRLLRTVGSPALRRPLLATAILGVLTVGDGFIYLSLQQRDDFAATLFPLLYVGTNVAYLSLAVPFGRLADRLGRARVLVGGHVALLLAYLVAGVPAGGVALTALTLLLLGTFYAATDGVLAALVSRTTGTETRGSAIASVQTVVAVARFASSLIFGGLWVALGRGQAMLVIAALLAAAIPVAAWILWPADSSAPAAEPA